MNLRCLLLACLILTAAAGCATPPAKLADVHQAFPDAAVVSAGDAVPAEASKSAIFEVSYDDLFRLVNVSANQAQLLVEDVQQKSGLIYATRAAMLPVPLISDAPIPHRFFYVIVVKELGPKRTQVRIAAKVQAKCEKVGVGMRAFTDVFTLGVSEILFAPMASTCDRLSTPDWALNKQSTDQEMTQFMTFLRNNLLAARLI